MQEILTTQFVWAVLLVGGLMGVVVLAKAPELLVAVLLVGPEYIQFILRILGYPVSRRTFAAAGGVVFIPVVILFLVMRMVQVREREPIIGRPNFSFVGVALVMGVWLLVGLTYTDSWWYGDRKTAEYFMFGLAPMFLPFVFLRDRTSVRRFLFWAILVAGTYVLIASSYSLATEGTIFAALPFRVSEQVGMAIPGHGVLSTPLVITMGALLAFSASRTSGKLRVLPILLLPVVALYIVLAGTRSNLVSFLFVSSVGFWFTYKKHRAAFLVALLVLAITAALLVAYAPPEVQERMFSSWIEPKTRHGAGGAERIEHLKAVPAQFVQAPILGHGTGDWPLLYTGLEWYAFPHNMFAEILVENGLVGLFILLTLWFVVVRRIWRILRDGEPGTGLYGIAVFGGCLLAIETTNALAHFGIAHAACTFLLTSAVTLRATYLEQEAVTSEARPPGEIDTLVRPVLKAGPLA